MWNRTLSRERFPTPYERFHACSSLRQALERVQAKRLVVGHTPQLGGANCECEGCVWRIDVGMSSGVLNRPVQVTHTHTHTWPGSTAPTVLLWLLRVRQQRSRLCLCGSVIAEMTCVFEALRTVTGCDSSRNCPQHSPVALARMHKRVSEQGRVYSFSCAYTGARDR